MTPLSCLLTAVTAVIALQNVAGQISGQSLYNEIIKRPELSQYRAWLTRSQLEQNLNGNAAFTIFAPNNTAFEQMSADKRQRFNAMDMPTIGNYIWSLAMYSATLQTSSMQDESVYNSHAENQEKLFIAVKQTVGGQAGVNQYYVNGARIVNADIRCSNGILHIIDFIPEPVSNKFMYGYLRTPDLSGLRISEFFKELLLYLPESEYDTIPTFKQAPKMTMFVPSDEAMRKIPRVKLEELRGNKQLLNQVIQRHYILNQAIHTSWVVHRQQFDTELLDEKIIFRKIKTDNYPERVYVMSEGVNAEITFGNITVANGVLHVVDTILGFKYNSALQQIDEDTLLNSFSGVLRLANAEIQNILRDQQGSQQVTVFAPTNDAISDVVNLPGVNFESNATLVDLVVRYHVLEQGNALVVMDVNKQYESREMRRTMYQGQNVVIYQRFNETFVEAGYVRARVVKPDVGVTNGYVQYIDRVFGVPAKDIPTTVCEDPWLFKSFLVLNSLTLGEYLRDRGLSEGSPGRTCISSFYGDNNNNNRFKIDENVNNRNSNNQNNQNFNNNNQNQNNYNQYGQYVDYQNVPQEFTVFLANGSVLEYFESTNLGRAIMQDNIRYRWVMRRHIIPYRTIRLDKLTEGSHIFRTDNGEEIVVRKNGYGIRTYVEVIFGRKRAQVIHMDLGATNGIVHILRDILAVEDDRTRWVSAANGPAVVSIVTLLLSTVIANLL